MKTNGVTETEGPRLTDAQVVATVRCPDQVCRAGIGAECVRRSFGSGLRVIPHYARRVRAQSVAGIRPARDARAVRAAFDKLQQTAGRGSAPAEGESG